jgi:hypothetical protein
MIVIARAVMMASVDQRGRLIAIERHVVRAVMIVIARVAMMVSVVRREALTVIVQLARVAMTARTCAQMRSADQTM